MRQAAFPTDLSDEKISQLLTHRNQVKYVGQGAYHYVFKITIPDFAPMAFRVMKEVHDGKIGPIGASYMAS